MLQTAEHVGCVTAGGDGQCGDDDDGDVGDDGDGGVLCLLVSPGLPPVPLLSTNVGLIWAVSEAGCGCEGWPGHSWSEPGCSLVRP